MSSIATLVANKIDESGQPLAAIAKQTGISLPSLRAVANGKSLPNARSLDKYAKFVGVSAEDLKAAVVATKEAGGPKKRKGKPGRKPGKVAKGKPGRKPGKVAKGKPGRKPGRKAAGGSSNAGAALRTISDALGQAESLLGDDLAMAVNRASKGVRNTIAALLSALG